MIDQVVNRLPGVAIKPFLNPKKPVDESIKTRIMLAGLGGISAAATGLVLRKMSKTLAKTLNNKVIASTVLGGMVTGYTAPSVINQYYKGKDTLNDSVDRLQNYRKTVEGVANSSFNKTAAPISTAWNVAKGGLSIIKNTGLDLARGYVGALKGSKNPNVFQKGITTAARIGTVGAVGYGGYSAYKSLSRPRSKNDYTTYLRNNMLAGNINPSQVDSSDLAKVKDLGIR